MQQVLIQADGFEPSEATQEQLVSVSAALQQIAKDPRVKTLYGTTGHSVGCSVICEVRNQQEANSIAGYLRLSGFPEVEVTPLIPSDQMQSGIQEAWRFASTPSQITQSTKSGKVA